MILFFLKTVWYYFLAILFYKLNYKKNSRLYWSGYCLYGKMSYRLSEKANADVFIAFRVFKRAAVQILADANNIEKLSSGSTAILDGSFKFLDMEPGYVQEHSGRKVSFFIAKSFLPGNNTAMASLFLLGVSFVLTIVIFPLSLLTKRKAGIALFITEILECTKLLYLVKKHTIKEIYDFIPYEKDSNINALLLMNAGVKIYKLPSPGPLYTHNRVLIANTLIVSSPYHLEELASLPQLYIDNWEKWLPEYSHKYLEKYKQFHVPPANTIAYYSHGSWLRKKEGNNKSVLFNAEAEPLLLTFLKNFLKQNAHVSLLIFPHPGEKKIENRESTMKFYDTYFKGSNYTIITNADTAQNFEMADVALTTYSTVMLERLFCGYKGLFFNYGLNTFPALNSNLLNVACPKVKILNVKLKEALEQSTDEFFITNKITGYRYFEYFSTSKRKTVN